MSKAIKENKWEVGIKGVVWESKFYWKHMCADKNNDKNKMNLPPPPPPSTPVLVSLIAEKLLHLWLWNFQAFSSLFLLTFCEKLSVIAWVNYFILQICWR